MTAPALALALALAPSLAAAASFTMVACRARPDSAAQVSPSSAQPTARPMPESPSSPVDPHQPSPAAAIPLTRVYQSAQSAFAEPVELVVRSETEWARAWLGAHPNRAAALPPAPAVDFTAELVIVVSPGQQSTGGTGVGIDSVLARADGGTDVVYTVRRAGAGCMTTQQLTAPVDVVRVPRRSGVVRFVRHDRTTPC